jgi:S1-C subfamily serine protease
MRGMKLAATLPASCVLVLAGAFAHPAAAQQAMSIQEVILRAKPATVLVIAEVASEVTLDCGSGPRKVSPNPFRETGTGWFVDGSGWAVTNAHVVQPAHQPPRWLVNQQAQKAVMATCVAETLARRGIGPGERPDVEEQVRREALDRILPRVKVDLSPSVSILLSNGIRLAAKVAKYSPPVSAETGAAVMSGRDLALLQVEASDVPALPIGDSREIRIGDPIRILGFPGVVLTHELLNASSKVEASVTNGAVSGFKQDVQDQPVIQTDAPAAWGNSGGPAVNDKGEVVGVLTFVSLAPGPEGGIVQGFNFVIPAEAVREFLGGTPVNLTARSPFNEAWFSGVAQVVHGGLHGRGRRLSRGQPAPARDARRQAGAGRGGGQDQESPAPPVPLGARRGRRHRGQPERLRRDAGPAVAAQSLPRLAVPGGEADGGWLAPGDPGCAPALGLLGEPGPDPGRPLCRPRRARAGRRHPPGRAHARGGGLLHLTRRAHQRPGGAAAQAARLPRREDPQGRARKLDQRRAAAGVQADRDLRGQRGGDPPAPGPPVAQRRPAMKWKWMWYTTCPPSGPQWHETR